MSRARVAASQSSQVSQSQRRKVYHIFSGHAGRTDAYGQPDSLAHFFGPDVDVEEIDLLNDVDGSPSENDILDAAIFGRILADIQSGCVVALVLGTPCETYSVLRFTCVKCKARLELDADGNCRCGQHSAPPLRTRAHPQGLPAEEYKLSKRSINDLAVANKLAERSAVLAQAAYDAECDFVIENPIDRADPPPLYDKSWIEVEHAPLWLQPCIKKLKAATRAEYVHLPQCSLGADFQKWTSLLCSPRVRARLQQRLGSPRCVCEPGSHPFTARGDFSKQSAAYPKAMNSAIANAFIRSRNDRWPVFCEPAEPEPEPEPAPAPAVTSLFDDDGPDDDALMAMDIPAPPPPTPPQPRPKSAAVPAAAPAAEPAAAAAPIAAPSDESTAETASAPAAAPQPADDGERSSLELALKLQQEEDDAALARQLQFAAEPPVAAAALPPVAARPAAAAARSHSSAGASSSSGIVLTAEQREAEQTPPGIPMLLFAPAGSGKTGTLAARAAFLQDWQPPNTHILALTFTNKAACELRERMPKGVHVFTFDSS